MELRSHKPLVGSGYAVSLLMVAVTGYDLAMRLLPVRNELNWRLGAVGMVSLELPTLLLAALILALTATYLGHRPLLRVIGLASIAVAILMLASLALFALDVMLFRDMIPPDGRTTLLLTMARAGLAVLLSACGLAWIGWASWKVGDSKREGRNRVGGDARIVATPSRTPAAVGSR